LITTQNQAITTQNNDRFILCDFMLCEKITQNKAIIRKSHKIKRTTQNKAITTQNKAIFLSPMWFAPT